MAHRPSATRLARVAIRASKPKRQITPHSRNSLPNPSPANKLLNPKRKRQPKIHAPRTREEQKVQNALQAAHAAEVSNRIRAEHIQKRKEERELRKNGGFDMAELEKRMAIGGRINTNEIPVAGKGGTVIYTPGIR